jgi:hypothetical protein
VIWPIYLFIVIAVLAEIQYFNSQIVEVVKKKRQRRYQRGYVKARYECLKAQYERYGYRFCVLCRGTQVDIGPDNRFLTFTTDHIEPWSWEKTPTVTADDLQVLCQPCNLGKGNRDDNDYR